MSTRFPRGVVEKCLDRIKIKKTASTKGKVSTKIKEKKCVHRFRCNYPLSGIRENVIGRFSPSPVRNRLQILKQFARRNNKILPVYPFETSNLYLSYRETLAIIPRDRRTIYSFLAPHHNGPVSIL